MGTPTRENWRHGVDRSGGFGVTHTFEIWRVGRGDGGRAPIERAALDYGLKIINLVDRANAATWGVYSWWTGSK